MSVSRQDYVSTIRGCYPGQKITMTTLIETIISKYGKDNSMTETMLDNILNILLGEGKDLAFTVHNEPALSKKLKFHFDTQLGEGFFTTK